MRMHVCACVQECIRPCSYSRALRPLNSSSALGLAVLGGLRDGLVEVLDGLRQGRDLLGERADRGLAVLDVLLEVGDRDVQGLALVLEGRKRTYMSLSM